MTADPDKLLSEFVDAWTAGRRPDVDDYLARAPDDRRAELASAINTYLTFAPTPEYDDAAWDAIAGDPLVREIVATPEPLAPLVARLRERAKLSVRQLTAAMTPELGIEGREEKTERYLERLERGDLDPRGLSERLIGALGRALRVPAEALADAARSSPRPRPSPAFFRAEPSAEAEAAHHLEVLAEAMAAPAPEGQEWDDVDELFLGGR